MLERRFPTTGTTVPPLLARKAIVDRIIGALSKPNPDHLQVIGARLSGKTVLLKNISETLIEPRFRYTAVLQWDLGHQTPASDELFMKALAEELSTALKKQHPDYSDYLKKAPSNPYHEIAEVLDLLTDEDVKILAILDGLDRPLLNGQLTRNVWDQMRELSLKPSLRLVTASRRTLRDLIRHPDTQASEFWNIFDPTPIRVGCFNENDVDEVLSSLTSITIAGGAKTELWNATNGFPVIFLEVLNGICNTHTSGSVSAESMLSACELTYPALRDKLDALWDDCPPSCQELQRRVIEENEIPRAGVINSDADTLIERGFVHQSGNKLHRSSQLLKRYLSEQPNEGSALTRLFSSKDRYQKNFCDVLENRISHIENLDPTLRRYLVRGVEDLPKYPNVFLSNVHGILENILSLIWKTECWSAENKRPHIPSEWFSIWSTNDERGFDNWRTRFPEGGQRLRLLDLMTGTPKVDRLATYITKNTYVLANAVQGFRDFGVHPKATEVTLETAFSALHVCIELAATITDELKKPSR